MLLTFTIGDAVCFSIQTLIYFLSTQSREEAHEEPYRHKSRRHLCGRQARSFRKVLIVIFVVLGLRVCFPIDIDEVQFRR